MLQRPMSLLLESRIRVTACPLNRAQARLIRFTFIGVRLKDKGILAVDGDGLRIVELAFAARWYFVAKQRMANTQGVE